MNYNFYFDETLEGSRKELIKGKFDYWGEWEEENGVFNWGAASLELGCACIELNFFAESNEDGSGYINKPCVAYFLCVKGTGFEDPELAKYGEYWEDAGYLDDFGYEVSVNWNNDNWLKQLEKDMYENLIKAVKEFDFKTEEYNFIGNDDSWAIRDRMYGIER